MAIAFVKATQVISGTSVAAPAGIVTGYLLICIQTYANATSTSTPASGFTEVAGAAIANATASTTFRTFWKVATSSEPASYTFTNSTAVYQDLCMLLYSGTATTTPNDVASTSSYASVSTTSGVTFPTVTTTAAGDLFIGAVSGPTTPTWTPTAPLTSRSGAWDGNDVVDTIIASAGSSGTLVDKPSTAQSNVVATVATFKAAGGGVATVKKMTLLGVG